MWIQIWKAFIIEIRCKVCLLAKSYLSITLFICINYPSNNGIQRCDKYIPKLSHIFLCIYPEVNPRRLRFHFIMMSQVRRLVPTSGLYRLPHIALGLQWFLMCSMFRAQWAYAVVVALVVGLLQQAEGLQITIEPSRLAFIFIL